MRAALYLVAALGSTPVLAQPHPLDGTVWDLATGERIEREVLARRLAGADIAILGEVHDNPLHHLAQAWLVGRIRPAGVAFEMLDQAQEAVIAGHLAADGAPGEIGSAVAWNESGWPDWELYRPIFEAWTPMRYTGGAVARAQLMQAGVEGAAALAPAPRFEAILSEQLDPETQAALADEMIAAHCDKLPRAAAAGMVEIQRLRDASFADAALRAHEAGGPTVLVTGNGHARADRGVPAYLRAVAPELEVVSIGILETHPEAPALADYDLPYDFAWFTAPAERDDPCESFRTRG